jgi:hypothetical protein
MSSLLRVFFLIFFLQAIALPDIVAQKNTQALSPLSGFTNETEWMGDSLEGSLKESISILQALALQDINPGLAFTKALSARYPEPIGESTSKPSLVFKPNYGLGLVAGVLQCESGRPLGGALILSKDPPLDRAQHSIFFKFWNKYPILKQEEEKNILVFLKALNISYQREGDIFYLSPENLKKWKHCLDGFENILNFCLEPKADSDYGNEQDIQKLCSLFDSGISETEKKDILSLALINYFRLHISKKSIKPNQVQSLIKNVSPVPNKTDMQVVTIFQKLFHADPAFLNKDFFSLSSESRELSLPALVEYLSLFMDWMNFYSPTEQDSYKAIEPILYQSFYYLSDIFYNFFLDSDSLGVLPLKEFRMNSFQELLFQAFFINEDKKRRLFLKDEDYAESVQRKPNLSKMFPDGYIHASKVEQLKKQKEIYKNDEDFFKKRIRKNMLIALNTHVFFLHDFIKKLLMYNKNFEPNSHRKVLLRFGADLYSLKQCHENLSREFDPYLEETLFDAGDSKLGWTLSEEKGSLNTKTVLKKIQDTIENAIENLDFYYLGYKADYNETLSLQNRFFIVRVLSPDVISKRKEYPESEELYKESVIMLESLLKKSDTEELFSRVFPGAQKLFLSGLCFWNHAWPENEDQKKSFPIPIGTLPTLQEQLSFLENTYNTNPSLSCYAAFTKAYTHLLLALRKPDQKEKQSIQAKEWLHRAFLKVKDVSPESLSNKDGNFAFSIDGSPLFSLDLQKTNTLLHFFFFLLFEQNKKFLAPTTQIHFDEERISFSYDHQLLNALIEEETKKKSPDTRLILCILKFKLGLVLPFFSASSGFQQELFQCMEWNLPEPLFLELFAAFEAERNPHFLVYADILRSYFEKYPKSQKDYPQLTKKLCTIFEEISDYSIQRLAFLVRYQYDTLQCKEGLRTILVLEKKMMIKDSQIQKLVPFKTFPWPDDIWDFTALAAIRPYVEKFQKFKKEGEEIVLSEFLKSVQSLDGNLLRNIDVAKEKMLDSSFLPEEKWQPNEKEAILEVLNEQDYFSYIVLHIFLRVTDKFLEENCFAKADFLSQLDALINQMIRWDGTKFSALLFWTNGFNANDPKNDFFREKFSERVEMLAFLRKIQTCNQNPGSLGNAKLLKEISDSPFYPGLHSSTKNRLSELKIQTKNSIKAVREKQKEFESLLKELYSFQQDKKPFSNLKESLEALKLFEKTYPAFLEINPCPDLSQGTSPSKLFQFAEEQCSPIPGSNSYKILQTLEQCNVQVESHYQESLAFLKKCFNDPSENPQKIRTLFEKSEILKGLEKKRFNLFFDEARILFQKELRSICEVLGPLKKSRNFTKNHDDHSLLSERDYYRLVQISFISSYFLQWFDQNSQDKEIKKLNALIDPLREIYFISRLARVIHELKVHRLMLRVLLKTEEIQREKSESETKQAKGPILKYYDFVDSPLTMDGQTLFFDLNNFSSYKDFLPLTRFNRCKEFLFPGELLRFFKDEEAFQMFKKNLDSTKVPIFEVLELQKDNDPKAEGRLLLSWINQNAFSGQSLASIFPLISQQGVIAIESNSNLKNQHLLLQQILENLTVQLPQYVDPFLSNLKNPEQEQQPKDIAASFQLKINGNGHNPLIAALLGLSPSNPPIENSQKTETPLPLAAQSLNPRQRAICHAVLDSIGNGGLFLMQCGGGTGKTHLTKILNQCLLILNPQEKILITAPTHVAVDKAFKVHKNTQDLTALLIRFASTLVSQEIDEEVLPFWKERSDLVAQDFKSNTKGIFFHTLTGFNGDSTFRKFLNSLSATAREKFEKYGSRSFIWIDEASMATLPETLLLLQKRAAPEATLVLLGDKLQMPPHDELSPGKEKKIRDIFKDQPVEGSRMNNFEGVNLETLFNLQLPWLREILTTSILDNHGRYGFNSYSVTLNYRSTTFIVKALNQMGYSERGTPMESARLPLSIPPKKQVMFFDTTDLEKTHEWEGRKSYVNPREIYVLLKQMADDFVEIPDLKEDEIIFISPYKSQINAWKTSLQALAILEKLHLQKQGENNPFAFENSAKYLEETVNKIQNLVQNVFKESIDLDRLKTADTQPLTPNEIHKLTGELEEKLRAFIPKKIRPAVLSKIIKTKSLFLSNTKSSTVHKVQGEQNRAIYISYVRSNSYGNLGFLGSRLGFNMQITAAGRAEDFLRVAASKTTWEKAAQYNREKSPQLNATRMLSARTMLKFIKYAESLKEVKESLLPFNPPPKIVDTAA